MSLETNLHLNVDFYNSKYTLINAKQYDHSSRWITITCYDKGDIFTLNANKHTVYVRYKKADGNGVLNSCRINYKGEVLVELTEQMLAAEGMCYVDLLVVNKGSAIVDIDSGEITTIDGSSILSTMAFCIDVYEAAIDNSVIESSSEYNGLNEVLQKANAEYKEVIQLSKSYAIGDANNIRENENFDNSKYYYEQALNSSNNASVSEANAESYMNNANQYMNDANEYMNTTESYMNTTNEYKISANEYMNNASLSEQNAKTSEENAKTSEENAESSKNAASISEANAKTSETNASVSEQNAKASEEDALNSANLAKSYAVGNTGTRDGEDEDNVQYYYQLITRIIAGLDSGFIPMGTISFSELTTVEKNTGYVYNISDDFITDDSFAEGSGKSYTAGTNVYYTASGKWDCFGGASYPTATVDEIKSYLDI